MGKTMDRVTDVATVLAGLSAVVIAGFVVTGNRTSVAPPGQAAVVTIDEWEVFAEDGHRMGPEDAAVTIVEFGDYQCPFCREAEPHLKAILREFDDVALVYHHNPLSTHALAYPAARAVECAAQQDNFWPYHDELWRDVGWGLATNMEQARDAFLRLADNIGIVDQSAFSACLASDAPVETVEAGKLLASAAGFSGTPSFLVNGRKHPGVLDSLWFRTLYEATRD